MPLLLEDEDVDQAPDFALLDYFPHDDTDPAMNLMQAFTCSPGGP